ncbi:hypothetical protein [Lacticaseibacillus parakribbianus]|uniref:hypothetical protein n=1 Tax=Lacticaseibacillus parakribbianus TaxID=2970927 RepID=UPI0021CAF227|nr:hypothetical protein [Lacticaseibacillus parakribbianus]
MSWFKKNKAKKEEPPVQYDFAQMVKAAREDHGHFQRVQDAFKDLKKKTKPKP